MLRPSAPFTSTLGEHGLLVDEAQGIAGRVVHVKGPFSPWTLRNRPHRQLSIAGSRREATGTLGALIDVLQILDREIDVLEIGARFDGVAVGLWTVDGENYAAAREVVPTRRDAHAFIAKKLAIKMRRAV